MLIANRQVAVKNQTDRRANNIVSYYIETQTHINSRSLWQAWQVTAR